jgi:hypothetical protein
VILLLETKGKTVEEIDVIFDGEKHSSVPDVEMVRRGKDQIDVKATEGQIEQDVTTVKVE